MLHELRELNRKIDEAPPLRYAGDDGRIPSSDEESSDFEAFPRPRRRRRRQRQESDDEQSEGDDYPRPHIRLPGLLYQGVEGAARGVAGAADATRRGVFSAADISRRGLVGAADISRRGLRGIYNRLPRFRRQQEVVAPEIQEERNRLRQEEEQLNQRRQIQNMRQELLRQQQEILEQEKQIEQQQQQSQQRQPQPQQPLAPSPIPSMQQELERTRQQTAVMQQQLEQRASQARQISQQMKREKEIQQSILRQSQQLSQPLMAPQSSRSESSASYQSFSRPPSLASQAASAVGNVVPSLLVEPIKAIGSLFSNSLTSSDVFPQAQQTTSDDIFPPRPINLSSNLDTSRTAQNLMDPLQSSLPLQQQPNIMSPSQIRSVPQLIDTSRVAQNLMDPFRAPEPVRKPLQPLPIPQPPVSQRRLGLKSSDIGLPPTFEVVSPEEVQQCLAQPEQIPEYNQPLLASYYDLPSAFVDDPFPEIADLPKLDLSYLEGG